VTGRFRGRGTTWVNDVRGGLNAIIIEAIIVLALIVFTLVVAFVVLTVV
jgi:hypothetical protein